MRDDGLHVEGYPEAKRVAQLKTMKAKRLADMRLHQSDLGFCERVLQIFSATLGDEPNDAAQALWISVLTKFYSCFGNNKGRSQLDAQNVYKGNPEALTAFRFYSNIRNKHIVHDESNYNYSFTGVVLGPEADVQDILSLQFQAVVSDAANGQLMYNLVDAALKYVSLQVDALLAEILKEVHALSPQGRAALPDIKFIAPTVGDEGERRKH